MKMHLAERDSDVYTWVVSCAILCANRHSEWRDEVTRDAYPRIRLDTFTYSTQTEIYTKNSQCYFRMQLFMEITPVCICLKILDIRLWIFSFVHIII